MTTDRKFEGWGAFDKDSIKGQLKWFEYEPKQFQEDDIEIEIQYCGICGSDLHTMSSGWGDMSKMYPQVVGHEIVGKVVRVGKDVKHLKEGDLAGIGAQCDSCMECDSCKSQDESYCGGGITGTYAGVFQRGPAKGSKSFGGYANYWRGPAHFAVSIPDNLDPAEAAPMLCGGVTVYSPLVEYGAGSKAKNVGIVGIGGLGHFGLLFAKAMGAHVTAISSSHRKDEDAKKLGADKVLVIGDDPKEAFKDSKRSLDLIICTSNAKDLPLKEMVGLLRPHGHFVFVGIPEEPTIPKLGHVDLIMANAHVTGSAIGSPSRIAEMLKFAGDHKIKGWVKRYPLDKANEAVVSMDKGEARYRYVLVNTQNGGKLEE